MSDIHFSKNQGEMIAEGKLTNYSSWAKIGFNGDVDNVEEDIIPQGGTYKWLPSGTQLQIASTSNLDNQSSAGARAVKLYYLDTNGIEQSEDILLNGTALVSTAATDIYRVQNMRLTSTGALYCSTGNLTLVDMDGTLGTYGYIRSGFTRQRQISWTVPSGKCLYVTSITVSGVNAAANHWARFTTRATFDDKSGEALPANFFMPFHEIQVVDQSFERLLEIPTKLQAGVDLKMTAISDASNSNEICSCALRGYTIQL